MKLQIISFTQKGAVLSKKIQEKLWRNPHLTSRMGISSVSVYGKCSFVLPQGVEELKEPLSDWTAKGFAKKNALLFIGAAGIAVRSIAPFIEDKREDPPVLVMDEKGEYLIPLLSGHLGHANDLAKEIGALLSAVPILTTTSDVNHLLALDVFADHNGFYITDMKKCKKAAAKLVNGQTIRIGYDARKLKVQGNIPGEGSCVLLQKMDEPEKMKDLDVWISDQKQSDDCSVLQLVPKINLLGVGCKKGKSMQELIEFLEVVLQEENLDVHSIAGICSIDRKAREMGIMDLAKYLDVPFLTFDAETLMEQSGEFSKSDFVKSQLGTDNVCERAVVAAGAQHLIRKKSSHRGITLAIGCRKGRIEFE